MSHEYEDPAWLEGFAVGAALLGVRGDELRELLPAGAPVPSWWAAATSNASREVRSALLSPALARLRLAVLKHELRF